MIIHICILYHNHVWVKQFLFRLRQPLELIYCNIELRKAKYLIVLIVNIEQNLINTFLKICSETFCQPTIHKV